MGSSDCADSLALDTEVIAMWFLPLTITPRFRKTRSDWHVTLRVQFWV